jgi:hypothetical protein
MATVSPQLRLEKSPAELNGQSIAARSNSAVGAISNMQISQAHRLREMGDAIAATRRFRRQVTVLTTHVRAKAKMETNGPGSSQSTGITSRETRSMNKKLPTIPNAV